MNQSILKCCVIAVLVMIGAVNVFCQGEKPEVFESQPIPEQLKYLEEHTRIYENFRAIREDIFQTITRNVNDTLRNAKNKINRLNLQTAALNSQIDSLKASLETTNGNLREMIRTKESIKVLGIGVNKVTYNSIMWTIVGGLLLLLAIGYLSFRRNRVITVRTKKDLAELKEEFTEYQKKTRLEREKVNIDHFNEIKKLKEGLSSRR